MNYSHPVMIWLRSNIRRFGLAPVVGRFVNLGRGTDYEKSFAQAVLSSIRLGDVVWDVGANIGFYSLKFADLVSTSGRAVAFEPSPGTFDVLSSAVRGRGNVQPVHSAVADFEGSAEFFVGPDANDPTSSLAGQRHPEGRRAVQVPVIAGEVYIRSNPTLAPNVIKIDVEGYEGEVVRGLGGYLGSPRLRAVFVECHFKVFAERGMRSEPQLLVSALETSGFQIRWVDPSHIAAIR